MASQKGKVIWVPGYLLKERKSIIEEENVSVKEANILLTRYSRVGREAQRLSKGNLWGNRPPVEPIPPVKKMGRKKRNAWSGF